MYFWRSLTVFLVLIAVCSQPAFGTAPSEWFERGQALLAGGDLHGTLTAYAEAVRGDRGNQAYLQEFMIVRRAIALEQMLSQEEEAQRWLQVAQALRAFYVDKGLQTQALEVDTQIHARQNNGSSAIQLAETQLALNMNDAAEKVLRALGPQKATATSQALLAVAKSRQGKSAEARLIAQKTASPPESGPGTLYSMARMHAAVGNTQDSLLMLARCFEATPPSRLATLKSHAKQCPEFASMASSPSFRDVLQTESKIPESKCSAGSSCAGCPMRGKCPSARGQ
jgi:hypothetical protein